MLRLLVLLLLLANGGYYAWSQGLLRDWGFGPGQPSEPQHLQQQIKPELVRILPASEARRSDTVVLAKTECLLAGPLQDAQLAPVRQVLQSWPAGSWSFEPVLEPARWIVYMGPYPGVEQLARKKAELRQIGVTFEPLADPALEPGLSLGQHDTEADANAQMQALAQKGVRSARVLQDRPPSQAQTLKLPAVDDSLRPRVEALQPVLSAIKLRPCQ